VPFVETKNLVKHCGRIEALRGVSLTVEKGEILGLLGQNGAGKTTLIKILLGITRLTEGSARLLDEPAGTAHVRRPPPTPTWARSPTLPAARPR
jgi:ABC-2 type transport system ATP-binding protein